MRARLIAHELYKKYVAIGSEWEINISFQTRGDLTAKLHHLEPWMSTKNQGIQMWEMVMLFEDSKNEMYRLMRHSFARFRRHDNFEKLRVYFNEKLQDKVDRERQAKAKDVGNGKNGAYHVLGGASTDKIGSLDEPEMVDGSDIIADIRKDDGNM